MKLKVEMHWNSTNANRCLWWPTLDSSSEDQYNLLTKVLKGRFNRIDLVQRVSLTLRGALTAGTPRKGVRAQCIKESEIWQ